MYQGQEYPERSPFSPESIASTWKKVREICDFFLDVDEKDVHIGVYASRPGTYDPMVGGNGAWDGNNGGRAANSLVVEFEDLEFL